MARTRRATPRLKPHHLIAQPPQRTSELAGSNAIGSTDIRMSERGQPVGQRLPSAVGPSFACRVPTLLALSAILSVRFRVTFL